MRERFAICLVVALGVFACAPRSSENSLNRPCLYNLRMVEAAKGGFATAHASTNGMAVTVTDLLPFVKASNTAYFTCPRGQAYALGAIGDSPRCPVHGSINDIMSRLKMGQPNEASHGTALPRRP